MNAEEIARLAYETNLDIVRKAEKEFNLTPSESEYLLVTWEDVPQFIKDMYMDYVKLVLTYPPNTSPVDMQDGWIADQTKKGWKYGELFDEPAKTNPYLKPAVEWDEEAVNRYTIPVSIVNIFRSNYEGKGERDMADKYKLNDTIVVRHKGRYFRVFARDIANCRTKYYAVVDGYEYGSEEWNDEFDFSMNKFEVRDWYYNNMDFADIQQHAKLIERRNNDTAGDK